MNLITVWDVRPSTGIRNFRAVCVGPPPVWASMRVMTGLSPSSSIPATSARRRSICEPVPERQTRTRPRSCCAAVRSSCSSLSCGSRLIRKRTGVFSGPVSMIFSAVSGVSLMTIGVRRAVIHRSSAWMSCMSPSKIANRSSWGMNMTIEGGSTLNFCWIVLSFSSLQHLIWRCCCQPSFSSVRFTTSLSRVTVVAKASPHSGRCGFLGVSLQCMPLRGSGTSLVLEWLEPRSTVSHVRDAYLERCSAMPWEISVPRASANITSSKWREALAKFEWL
mmetsp:Transcript_1121/g.3184  ORF Transcript_1121/g.3184 Transcript_1121/m.3184 type:complete len:277 (-) Transcript_1121:468-1298(-)